MLRAAVVGALVTLGFVTVFGLIGLAASGFRSGVNRVVPYISMVVGLVLAGLGVAMLRGFEPKLRFLDAGTALGPAPPTIGPHADQGQDRGGDRRRERHR